MLLFHLLFSSLKLHFLQASHSGWKDSMASCQIKRLKDISMLIWFAINGQACWVFHHHLLTFLQQIFPVMLWVSKTPCLHRLGDTEKMCNPREWWQLLQSMLLTCIDSSMGWGLSGNLAMGPEAAWKSSSLDNDLCVCLNWLTGERESLHNDQNPLHDMAT